MKVFSYIYTGPAKPCSFYIHDNEDGKPGIVRYAGTYMPTHQKWDEITIPSPVTYSTDFWIVIKIPEGTPNEIILAVSDKGVHHPDRNATKIRNSPTWDVPSPLLGGDLCIRAIVSYVGVEEKELLPSEIVSQNYPNPVVNWTTISYTLTRAMSVKLKIYDITGKVVRTLVDEVQTIGQKKIVWDRKNEKGERVPSGVYFYKLILNDFESQSKAMIVL